MESLNEKIEKVLNFLSIIQNACDNKRSMIEQYSRKCYSTYLAELKANERRKDLKKSLPLDHNEKKEKKVTSLSESLEELAVADSLLDKARALRSKSKRFLKLKEPTLSTSLDLMSKPSVSISPTRTVQEKMLRSQSSCTLLSHSKSSLNIEFSNTSKLYHSNSLDGEVCMKRIKVPNGKQHAKSTLTKSSAFCKDSKEESLKNSDVGVISYKQFKDLKKFPVSQSSSEKSCPKLTTELAHSHCIVPKSDSSQSTFKKSGLSYRSYKDNLKGKLQSNFQCRKDGFWYPFINSKSETYLLEWAKCNTYGNFIKIIKLLYKIQEIMFWIDLLCLIGKEMFPIILTLDESDKNVVKFCSSLLSIYHERLQRVPLLNSE